MFIAFFLVFLMHMDDADMHMNGKRILYFRFKRNPNFHHHAYILLPYFAIHQYILLANISPNASQPLFTHSHIYFSHFQCCDCGFCCCSNFSQANFQFLFDFEEPVSFMLWINTYMARSPSTFIMLLEPKMGAILPNKFWIKFKSFHFCFLFMDVCTEWVVCGSHCRKKFLLSKMLYVSYGLLQLNENDLYLIYCVIICIEVGPSIILIENLLDCKHAIWPDINLFLALTTNRPALNDVHNNMAASVKQKRKIERKKHNFVSFICLCNTTITSQPATHCHEYLIHSIEQHFLHYSHIVSIQTWHATAFVVQIETTELRCKNWTFLAHKHLHV